MIIDGHAHIGGDYSDLTTILSTLQKTGIDKVVLCPSDTPRHKAMPIPDLAGRFPEVELNFAVNKFIRCSGSRKSHQANIESGNREISMIAGSSGGRVIQFFWANPLRSGIIEEVESKHKSWKFRGVKLHQGCHSFKVKSGVFHELSLLASGKNLPVFIHLYSGKEVSDFIEVSGKYKTNFIIGHLIGQYIFARNKEKLSDNVFFDISCPPLVSLTRIRKAVNDFGPGRIIMGSDTPFGRNNIEEIMSRVRSLNITSGECDMILGSNLRNLLNI
jgi:uncharacterized protein